MEIHHKVLQQAMQTHHLQAAYLIKQYLLLNGAKLDKELAVGKMDDLKQ